MLLPASAVASFTATYGVEGDLEWRALGWVVLFALMLVAIGREGRHTYEAVGRSALAKVIAHCDGMR